MQRLARLSHKPCRASRLAQSLIACWPVTPIAATAHGDIDAWSVMLYTSGTTGRPKGVPRIHRVERAAATAHVAQSGFRAW